MSHQSRYRIDCQPATLLSPILSRPSIRQRIASRLKLWRGRIDARRHLAAMDVRSLRDAGTSPAAAAYESGKPFWKPLGHLR